MKEIFVPAIGTAMTECVLLEWHRRPGDVVEPDAVVATIETDKATTDLVSPAHGRLGPHLFDTGAEVPAGATIACVFEASDTYGSATETAAKEESAAPQASVDVDRAGATVVAPPTENTGQDQTVSVTAEVGRRSATAAVVLDAWRSIPHFAVTRQLPADTLINVVRDLRTEGVRISITDVLLRTLSATLARHFDDDRVGLAVAADRGVLVPVLEGIPMLDWQRLADARREATARGRAGVMRPADHVAPLCTLSNLGAHGVDWFNGIIPVGQRMLLTVGRVGQRPVAENDVVVAASTVYATLNVDHRAIDGVPAAKVLATFAQLLSSPDRLNRPGAPGRTGSASTGALRP